MSCTWCHSNVSGLSGSLLDLCAAVLIDQRTLVESYACFAKRVASRQDQYELTTNRNPSTCRFSVAFRCWKLNYGENIYTNMLLYSVLIGSTKHVTFFTVSPCQSAGKPQKAAANHRGAAASGPVTPKVERYRDLIT